MTWPCPADRLTLSDFLLSRRTGRKGPGVLRVCGLKFAGKLCQVWTIPVWCSFRLQTLSCSLCAQQDRARGLFSFFLFFLSISTVVWSAGSALLPNGWFVSSSHVPAPVFFFLSTRSSDLLGTEWTRCESAAPLLLPRQRSSRESFHFSPVTIRQLKDFLATKARGRVSLPLPWLL